MSLDDKFNLERRIFIRLIEKHKQQEDIFSTAMLLAYEHGLQVLEEIYELSKQEKEEEYPF
ncbi:limonene cyclase [Bacillus pseudomycoides]|uniref:limonene cyclase n=1 Tax=Bacillus pseudomycoides TaxID=64104 RepID=UPI000BFA0968|nr:limonene cyclase [Bacillus pseudomycoides]MED4653064.1 limonene cyclase [Bacillus pseudomycoides]PGC23532.1 limonene cyclase [Bacillus pseudomycoides]